MLWNFVTRYRLKIAAADRLPNGVGAVASRLIGMQSTLPLWKTFEYAANFKETSRERNSAPFKGFFLNRSLHHSEFFPKNFGGESDVTDCHRKLAFTPSLSTWRFPELVATN